MFKLTIRAREKNTFMFFQDAESATGTGDLGPGRPVGLALGTPVPALGWALDGTLALQCRKLFGTDGNLALKCQEKAP